MRSSPTSSSGPADARLGAKLAMALAIAAGLSLSMFAPALAIFDPTDLPAPFPDQNQDAESFLFIFTLAIAVPAGILAGPRLADRIATVASPEVAAAWGTDLLAGLGAAVVATKLSERLPWGGGVEVLAAWLALWWIAVAVAVVRPLRTRPSGEPDGGRPPGGRRAALASLALVTVLLLLAFTDLSKVSIPVFAIGLTFAVLIFWLARARAWDRRTSRRLEGPAGTVLDLGAGLLLFAAAVNLVIFTPADPRAALETPIVQFHQNFFLGPANHVLAGDAMLVDTFSQYGVGSIYLLAGWFQLVPAGNGTLGLLDGGLSAAGFVAAFAICRLAGASRALAFGALAVGVAVLVYGLVYPLGALPQHGGIRFGLPFALLVAAVAEVRWSGRPRVVWVARAAELAVVGVSAIWALEGFIYTTATAAGLLVAGMAVQVSGTRRGWLARRLAAVLGVWVTAHLLLAGLTLAFSGSLPAWGRYLETLYAFLAGPVGDLTYDFTSFSAGFPVIAAYLASAVGIGVLWRSRPELLRREPVATAALTGTTAYGIALFSYFVNRSGDHIVPYVSLPAIVLGVLWLSLVRRTPELGGRRGWRAGLALGLGAAALAVSVAASSFDTRVPQSALGLAVPGGNSVPAALERLRDPPPLDPGAPQAVRFLEELMPDEERSLVLTSADLGVEALVRSGRANLLPLADPWEDSLVPYQHLDALRETVTELEPGRRMLIDEQAGNVFAALRAEPSRDPIVNPLGTTTIVPIGLSSLQQWALREIGERFRLRTVTDGGDLRVVELVPR